MSFHKIIHRSNIHKSYLQKHADIFKRKQISRATFSENFRVTKSKLKAFYFISCESFKFSLLKCIQVFKCALAVIIYKVDYIFTARESSL